MAGVFELLYADNGTGLKPTRIKYEWLANDVGQWSTAIYPPTLPPVEKYIVRNVEPIYDDNVIRLPL